MMMKITGTFDELQQNAAEIIPAQEAVEDKDMSTTPTKSRDTVALARSSTRLVGYMDSDEIGAAVDVGNRKLKLYKTDSLKMVTSGDFGNMTPITHGARVDKRRAQIETERVADSFEIATGAATPDSTNKSPQEGKNQFEGSQIGGSVSHAVQHAAKQGLHNAGYS